MLCRVLLHAINLRHGTDGFTSPPKGIFITHKNPPSSVGFEPATECPVGPVASTLTTGPPRAATSIPHFIKICPGCTEGRQTRGRPVSVSFLISRGDCAVRKARLLYAACHRITRRAFPRVPKRLTRFCISPSAVSHYVFRIQTRSLLVFANDYFYLKFD
jgi:hypothetical protein